MDFTGNLLEWFKANGRALPWRNCHNAYYVLVSEFILQQTRVSQGMGYYERFIATFPTIKDLAEAEEDAVLKVWQGLGYYSRARHLHACAKRVVQEYGGELPTSYDELLRLPGLGPYAAAAVASFAFGEAVPAIDGNVYRVLARVFGIFDSPSKASGKKIFRKLSEELISHERPADYNQAIIDFGALQCTPGLPQCEACPMESGCYALTNSLQRGLPTRKRGSKIRIRYFHYLMVKCGTETFMQKRGAGDIWQSLYQFPLLERNAPCEPEELLQSKEAREILGSTFTLESVSTPITQQLSHQLLHMRYYIIRIPAPSERLSRDFKPVEREGVYEYQMPVNLHNYLVAEESERYFVGGTNEEG